MDDLKEIYDRISFLRHGGVRMKDMAECAGCQPSVLSALYKTVIPTYLRNKSNGLTDTDALDDALVWVNNVSKKKLLAIIPDMRTALETMRPKAETLPVKGGNPYPLMIKSLMAGSGEAASALGGVYISYSRSSSSKAMKIEPYLITPSADGTYLEVLHNNAYGSTHRGFALLNGMSHIYIIFNESTQPQLSLFNICLKVPMYDRPSILRGVYTCFDYNYNPIARRIVFVKVSDDTSRTAFADMCGCLKNRDELDETELIYFDYTCCDNDVIRLCNIPSPTMTVADLNAEKDMLAGLHGKK